MKVRDSIKVYTLEKANRALPLVNKIVKDIMDAYSKLKVLQSRKDSPEEETEGLKETLVQLLDELDSLGVEFKGFEEGLVDFYYRKDGRLVYLCWKLGEDKISCWHELNSGYASRQPLDRPNAADKLM